MKCCRFFVAPILFAFSQRNQRPREALLETALNRIVGLINPPQDTTLMRDWPLEADLLTLRNQNLIEQLADSLTLHKSNKDTLGCTKVYQIIFAYIHQQFHSRAPRVVEIGIGSNNPNVASNMGVFGTPGASLRAFRDFFPSAKIVGGDIDRSILFSEPGITTHWVDQLDISSLRCFFTEAGPFDLLMEDGLHELDANLNTLCVALEFAEPGGWIVIEDINPNLEQIWLAVAKCLEPNHRCWVIRANVSIVFVAQRQLVFRR